ncbi:MAG: 16S rRNA (cytosine(967)-C(5))-methyltransferase RsmB [Leptothrix sp. (in: b-proteobacteria)]
MSPALPPVSSAPARALTPSVEAGPGQSLPLAQLLARTADAVARVLAGGSLTEALAACPAPARPGTQALSFHVLRWLGGAQAARGRLVSKRPAPEVDALLLCAIALLWPRSAPPYASHTLVDQAVACARKRHPASAGFVNAVLRRFLREADALVAQCEAEQPEALHQHPRWWITQLTRDWPQQWQALLSAANQAPPMTLRVNVRQTDAAGYQAELAAIGLASRVLGPQALVLAEPQPVQRLPGFATGRVSVQDLSAQHAAPLLIGTGADRLAAGARVLDACAAPGGKTAHLLELADLDVTALDVDAARLQRVDATLARLGLPARLVAADAGDPPSWWDGVPFDAILLDAPCSASGIVRRHPDVRWLRRASDITRLAQTQARLLDAMWPLLKPGGRLVFATCSVFRAEGAGQTAAFLQRTPNAIARPAPGHLLPVPDNGVLQGDGEVVHGDGFYYARFDRAD